jgi:hypothetical protein
MSGVDPVRNPPPRGPGRDASAASRGGARGVWCATARRGARTAPWLTALGAALLVLSTVAAPANAQVVQGRVTDASNGDGIGAAAVELFREDGERVAIAFTDGGGRFQVRLPGGEAAVVLEAGAVGYLPAAYGPVSVPDGGALELPDLSLQPNPFVLDSLQVEGRRPRLTPGREWVRRHQLLGQGTFLAGAVLRALDPPSLTQHVAEESGLWVRHNTNYREFRATADHDPLASGANIVNRFMQPFVSNPQCIHGGIVTLVNRWPLWRTGILSLDDIPLERIAAIEIYYDEREVPPGYAWDSECGLVNVWTWDSW